LTISDKKLNIAIIGYGKWAINYISTIYNSPIATIKWIVSRNKIVKDNHSLNSKVIKDWRDLFTEEGIDGIIVAVPPEFQCDIALRCMDENIPLLLEKPLALDTDTVDLLLTKCENNNSKVMVGYTYLYHQAYRKILELVHLIGPIKEIVSTGGNYGPFRDTCSVLWDWAPHDVSMCVKLMNDFPLVVNSKKKYVNNKSTQGEIIETSLLFSNGVKASLTFGNGMLHKKRLFKVIGDSGELVFDDLLQTKLVLLTGSQYKEIPVNTKSPLEVLTGEFFEMIHRADKSCFDVAFSNSVTKVISDIEYSLS